MKLELNLATAPFVNRLPQALLLGALLAAAAGLVTWNVLTIVRSVTEARAVEGELAELAEEESRLKRRAESLARSLQGVDIKPIQTEATAANEVLAQKALRWSLLLERLEELLPWRAALESIQARVNRDGVTLDLRMRAEGQDEILEFIDTLEASPCFSEAYPSTEIELKDGGFESTITVAHDPYCGNAPEVPGMKARGAVTRRAGSRG